MLRKHTLRRVRLLCLCGMWFGTLCVSVATFWIAFLPWWNKHCATQAFLKAIELGTPTEISESFERILQFEADEVVTGLIRLSRAEEPSKRSLGAYYIGQIAMESPREMNAIKDAIPTLICCLGDDEDPTIRWQAARSLGWIGSPHANEAVPALAFALCDPVARVRFECSLALARLKGQAKPAVPHLTKNLGDPDAWCRISALTAIEEIGLDPSELAPLLTRMALNDPDSRVRLFAVAAISRTNQKSKSLLDTLRKAEQDDSEEVREAARRGLDE